MKKMKERKVNCSSENAACPISGFRSLNALQWFEPTMRSDTQSNRAATADDAD